MTKATLGKVARVSSTKITVYGSTVQDAVV